MILGTLLVALLKNMVSGQSMMLDIVLVLSFPPLLEMESGYGRVLDRIVWWKYKVVCRKFQ
jgi:hypothetical protein